MRYRNHFCRLVFVHPTGVSSSRYPSPGASVTHALSRHGSSLQAPPMQTPGIRSNIQKCQTTRPAVPVYRCGVSLLYIKQLYTLPSVSRCQPPKLKSEYNTDVRLTRLDNTSPSSPNRLHTKFKLRLQLAFTKCSSLDAVCVSDSHRLL